MNSSRLREWSDTHSSITQRVTLSTSLALMAGLCWAGALTLLFLADLRAEVSPLAPQRLLFYTLVLAAGLLTFVPIQRHMRLSRLALEGVGGTALLLYTLAFVPPPTGWLLSLPDLPVYVLLILALFWSSAALIRPFLYALGQRIFRQRARRMDVRRSRRQSYEIGLFCACIAILGGLRVMTWVSILLVTLILITAEIFFLSRVEEEEGAVYLGGD
ncbi:MAG: hypothetical protein ACLFVO_21915 [Chloroflexaceae bacterium]